MEKSLKIVLVDDNTDYLFTMETFLSRNGYEVKTSEDAEKGLELIRSERPDMLLLDVMMETLFSGFELCKQMRMDDVRKGISGSGSKRPLMGSDRDMYYDDRKRVALDHWQPGGF